ncbi:hypothetical protein MMC29_002760 [Sticta canariensis]|nr:hypothetical protein [Sticta canariensis]
MAATTAEAAGLQINLPSHQDVLSVPAAQEPSSPLPKSFGCLLFPEFQALDVFGPLDALNVLSMRQENMTLAMLARTLEPVSTKVTNPAYNPLNTTFGQQVLPSHTFTDAPPLDVLIVPGGIGTEADVGAEIDFIRRTYPSLQYIIGVCTGAGLLARAGLLDGRNATTNKALWDLTTALGPRVHWITHARWVQDGNVWTSSGVSAGLDALFAWMKAVFGNDTATHVANVLEYERNLNASWDPFADLWNLTQA